MKVKVEKATEAQKKEMASKPVWGCDVSKFDWYYDSQEECLLIEGEVCVSYDDESVNFCAGDYVVFEQGLSCVWNVTKPVKKHYFFK
jgi:uncharacterized cupin superfamily protein